MRKRPQIRSGAREQRIYPFEGSIEMRDAGDGSLAKMTGHAAVYNSWSEDLGGFKERVLPGAFDKSIGVSDVRALLNHDANYIFARTTVAADAEGALSLASEKKGLHIAAIPLDTQTIRDMVIAPIRAGLVTQMSFSFVVREDVWREPKSLSGLYERDLADLELYDVSPVTFPAYTQTDVGVRALVDSGLDAPALVALFARGTRGLPLTDSDRDLLTVSIELLRSYLPEANGEEPSGANGEEPSRSDAPPAGRTRAQLLRELEHRRRVDHLAIAS